MLLWMRGLSQRALGQSSVAAPSMHGRGRQSAAAACASHLWACLMSCKAPHVSNMLQPPSLMMVHAGIDYKTSTTVKSVDLKSKSLQTESGDSIKYEKLIVATGSSVRGSWGWLLDKQWLLVHHHAGRPHMSAFCLHDTGLCKAVQQPAAWASEILLPAPGPCLPTDQAALVQPGAWCQPC